MSKDQQTSRWNVVIRRLLERAAYDLSDENAVGEICAKTGLDKTEVTQVLEGSRGATIEGIYRIASLLNVPAADLINPTRTVFQCYSADGGRPRTLSLTPEDSALLDHISKQPLLYADDLDDSYHPFGSNTTVVFSSKDEALEEGRLYLVESEDLRYVRHCISIDKSKGKAVLSDDGEEANTSTVSTKATTRVVSGTEHILGRVLLSINRH